MSLILIPDLSRRHVKASHKNTLLRDLQTISKNSKDISICETQLEMSHEDYQLGDMDISQLSKGRALLIERNITPRF